MVPGSGATTSARSTTSSRVTSSCGLPRNPDHPDTQLWSRAALVDDLRMREAAGYSVDPCMWKIESCRPAVVEKVALAVCDNPERHTNEVLTWAMDALELTG